MKPSHSKMPSPSSDETLSANTFNSVVDTTTAGIMTSISLTSLESNSTITPPSQHSEDGVGKERQQSRQHFNHQHHHSHHPPPCSFSRTPPHQSSLDQQSQQQDQQEVQDQITEPGQDPEQQEQSRPQQQQPHKQHQRPTSPPSSAQAHPNPNNKGKTALNEFITRSRSSTLYTPSDNERDEQIRLAILTRCLDMEDRFQVQAARYWGRLQ